LYFVLILAAGFTYAGFPPGVTGLTQADAILKRIPVLLEFFAWQAFGRMVYNPRLFRFPVNQTAAFPLLAA
jgi:hypothetical protein